MGQVHVHNITVDKKEISDENGVIEQVTLSAMFSNMHSSGSCSL